ncbi:MAG: glycoside hydrolase domain-containing protein [Longimicrobiales bacterium]
MRQQARSSAEWTTESSSEHFAMTVEGRLEYDGMLDYRITLVPRSSVELEDIRLPVSLLPDAAEYMLGLGQKGGRRPPSVDWTWAVENHQEGVWLGGIHKGLQYVLRDENYVRPLNTNFYRNQPLNMPSSWFNEGRGGIRIVEEGSPGGPPPESATEAGSGSATEVGSGSLTGAEAASTAETDASPTAVTAYNYSGPRSLAAGDTLHFNVRFLLTPFKSIDARTHFNTRFVHMYVPVDSVAAWGGTVVNIHHANEINPYINYPFFALDKQNAYIDEAHDKGIKVKLYYTIRELTYKANELFALRSLGDEILNDGEGGGHSWMQEHLEDHYHSAWHAWRVDDAAMLDKGTSRWTNYYVEGLSWLAEHQQIDGLYLDDIAFSRETVKRIVTVLSQERPEVVIDLHSANQFNVRDGFINSAMLYMEHFPFISRLWFGEYFEYGLDEDYWMTEVSGLPFGLMGEMLQDGGHPYRGMLYGMTARMYGNVDPRPVWGMLNDFGIAESRMLGYWLDDTPVTTGHPRILATTFARPGSVLIALASWAPEDAVVSLNVDWEGLGFGAGTEQGEVAGSDVGPGPAADQGPATQLRVYAPAVEGLQPESEVDLSAVPVPAGMGLFLMVTRDAANQS